MFVLESSARALSKALVAWFKNFSSPILLELEYISKRSQRHSFHTMIFKFHKHWQSFFKLPKTLPIYIFQHELSRQTKKTWKHSNKTTQDKYKLNDSLNYTKDTQLIQVKADR